MSISPRVPAAVPEPPVRPERRHSVRRSVVDESIVPVALAGDNGGLLLDLSETGMAVQAVARLQRGATTDLRFALPEIGARIQARGEVRWAEESGRAGIRILAFDEGSSEQLTTWMARSKPKAAMPLPVAVQVPAAAPALDLSQVESEIASRGLDLDGALLWIAERTRQAARATGVAIALGPRETMICRASSGAAPSLGVRLRADSGLSGECVRTGLMVRCDDTETDSRVDAAVCRSLDLRAAVLVPIYDGEELHGVLEIFSNRPRAFGTPDLHHFRKTADLISKVMRRFDATAAVAPQPAAPAAPVQPSLPLVEEVVAPPAADIPARPIEPEVVVDHSPVQRPAAAEPQSRPVGDVQVSTPAFSPARLSLVAVGVLVLMGGTWAIVRRQPVTRTATPPATAAAPAITTPSQILEQPVIAPPVATEQAPSPGSQGRSAQAVKSVPAERQEKAVTTEGPELALRRAAGSEPAVAPPQLASASTSLPSFAPPSGSVPKAPSAPSEGVTPGRLLKRVDPVYPDVARRLQIQGDVLLNAVVRADGSVGAIAVTQGNATLARAAVDAVRHWRYQPYKLNGVPVEVSINIRLHFSPTR